MELVMMKTKVSDEEWHVAVQAAIARLPTDTIVRLDDNLKILYYNVIGE